MGKACWAGWDRNHKDMLSSWEKEEECDVIVTIKSIRGLVGPKLIGAGELLSILSVSVLCVCRGRECICVFLPTVLISGSANLKCYPLLIH